MNTYILSENNLNFQELERKLCLLNTAIKAFLKKPEDLERYADLVIEKLRVERLLYILFYPEVEATGECISPNWEDIKIANLNIKTAKQDLELELSVLRKQRKIKQMAKKLKPSKLDILTVVENAGIKLKNHFILCPFHVERNPSCKIYTHTNTFYCFSCHKWGTAKDLADALGVKP